jgi:PII-like signaling protein
MKQAETGKLLRIFIGEQDSPNHQSLFEAIVLKAKEIGLAGSTVIRGIEGFGAASRFIHTSHLLRLSEDLPIIIEIVDKSDKIEAALSIFDDMIEKSNSGVLITLETVQILRYRHEKN